MRRRRRYRQHNPVRHAKGTSPLTIASLSRCPACNPMHTGSFMRRSADDEPKKRSGRGSRPAKKPCDLCGGTRRVPVDVSRRFVEAISPRGPVRAHDSASCFLCAVIEARARV